nr:hypothetical protein Iba_chr15dCG6740 [Ipomoea batatas]
MKNNLKISRLGLFIPSNSHQRSQLSKFWIVVTVYLLAERSTLNTGSTLRIPYLPVEVMTRTAIVTIPRNFPILGLTLTLMAVSVSGSPGIRKCYGKVTVTVTAVTVTLGVSWSSPKLPFRSLACFVPLCLRFVLP